MKFETKCVHAGYKAESGEPHTLPIAQSTTYRYYSTEDVAKLFDLESGDFMYSRLGNPTVAALESKMAELEGGSMAIASSAGMASSFMTIFNLCNAGDHIVSSQSIYGGTYNQFAVTIKKMGIDCTFVDQDAPLEELVKFMQPNTKAIFAETLGNPALTVLDFAKFRAFADAAKVPLIIDNTLATPVFCRPIEQGADFVIHSTTKYADGHASCVGGVVVEAGTFDWNVKDEEGNNKYPGMVEADESYHGLKFYETFGAAAFSVKLRAQMLRDLGSAMSPMNAYLTYQGLQTLHLRMAKHSENALKVAEFLQNHPDVAWVKYPGLKGDKYFDLAQKYLPKGQSGVLSFGLKGGREAGESFCKNLDLISIVVHVGDIRTCVLHPASSTHRQLSTDQQLAAGIDPGLIRLSVGIEDAEDIIEDLKNAIAKI
ncbi:MAG: O-acetylhomoserine aminocarboxypropyltransferase/cysteine synthase family protein [Anaerovoracaceae bacterium]